MKASETTKSKTMSKEAFDYIMNYKARTSVTPRRDVCYKAGYNQGFNAGLLAFSKRQTIKFESEIANKKNNCGSRKKNKVARKFFKKSIKYLQFRR